MHFEVMPRQIHSTEKRILTRDDLNLSYNDMAAHKEWGDRLNYLSLFDKGYVSPRQFSNPFYKSRMWRNLREEIIARDMGYDLGCPGVPIEGPIIVHHMIPLVEDDILDWNEDLLLNPDLLISTSIETHNIIHYGRRVKELVERKPGDTNLW